MRRVALGLFVLVAAAATAGACGGPTTSLDAADASEADGSLDEGGASDGGRDADDDGPVLDPTDAAGPETRLPDGGVCNTLANTAPAVTSTCAVGAPTLDGGALVSGKYVLAAVTVVSPTALYCKDKFLAVGFRETLLLTVDATSGIGTAQTVAQVGIGGVRHRSSTLAPGANNTSPAIGTQTCPATAPGNVRYASAVATSGRQQLSMLLPYGTGAAVYRFEKQ